MEPRSNEQAGLNLPTPVEQAGTVEAIQNTPESANILPQNASQNSAAQVPQMPSIPLPLAAPTTSPVANNDATGTTITDVPITADDGDLIEKEWVMKAKKIVQDTQDDPYKQSKELTNFKADYLQKRYNKNIKLSE